MSTLYHSAVESDVFLEKNEAVIKVEQVALSGHRLFAQLKTVADLRLFMNHHVVCVWDFMTLVKLLQHQLGGMSLPWTPPERNVARLINEIILEEETSLELNGQPVSHFEWYVSAMEEIGADTAPIKRYINLWNQFKMTHPKAGAEQIMAALPEIFNASGLPKSAYEHCRFTLSLSQRSLAVQAMVFYYSRENLIPQMFTALVQNLQQSGLKCDQLLGYLTTHIACDGEAHGPMAKELLQSSIQQDSTVTSQMLHGYAIDALRIRGDLWTNIAVQLDNA